MSKRKFRSSINKLTPSDPSSRKLLLLVIVLFSSCAMISTVRPVSGSSTRYRGGLRNSLEAHKLNAKQLELVLKSLREKSGFQEIHFDEDGFLKLGDQTKFIGGSASARALISAAVEAKQAIDLEAHNYSSIVAFARLANTVIYQSRATGDKINVYPIEIDFSDFQKLFGDKKAIAAFDIGFVVLHELGHAVLGLHDSSEDSSGPGDCEEYINRIRRELNLPERQNYFAKTRTTIMATSLRKVEQAELYFAQAGTPQQGGSPQRFAVSWDAMLVGPIREGSPSLSVTVRPNKSTTASTNGQ